MAKIGKNRLVFILPLAVLAAVTWLSLMPGDSAPSARWFRQIPHYDKIAHFVFYLSVAASLRLAFGINGKSGRRTVWGIFAFAVCYGIGIELLQGAFFNRGCEAWDAAANSAGALCATLAPEAWYAKPVRIFLRRTDKTVISD